MYTIKLTIEYDGTAYAGWQRQPNQPTIQAALETALTRITQQHISVIAAGRTDAGVHARGQVASFQSDKSIPIHKWKLAINSALPHDISVVSSERAPDSFHARYSAKEKLYEYRISRHPARPAIDRHRVWHLPYELDAQAIRHAMSGLVGRHDFTSFQGRLASTLDPMCDVSHISLTSDLMTMSIQMQANRFLKQMVRTIVGTLTEVGRHKRSPDSIRDILQAKDRRAAGETAPPQGLYLLHVLY
ncbi:MAG: tRNA pseudouridine(38-40) synthase TruA [Nitrospirota bacterium]|nr:tRNA pseudouridine(38-40) synthase TruA [Nitrospirota bacterium]MDH5699110.1 tRNA pseudouridine(38-40) synthase TruA [Nitrospirota bacterium]